MEQRNAVATGTLAPDIAAELEKRRRADFILSNFPIYWFGMPVPAILKGWIDRVFVSGVCYGGRRIHKHGGLAGKRAMLAFSLGGREHMFGPGAIHGELETLLQPIEQGMLGYVGLTVLPHFAAFHVPCVDEAARTEYLDHYRQHLLALDSHTPLVFHCVEHFDDQLRPKAGI